MTFARIALVLCMVLGVQAQAQMRATENSELSRSIEKNIDARAEPTREAAPPRKTEPGRQQAPPRSQQPRPAPQPGRQQTPPRSQPARHAPQPSRQHPPEPRHDARPAPAQRDRSPHGAYSGHPGYHGGGPREGYRYNWSYDRGHRPLWYVAGFAFAPFLFLDQVYSNWWQCTAFDESHRAYSASAPTENEAEYNALYDCGGASYAAECFVPEGYCNERY